jgi:hypothetical protein
LAFLKWSEKMKKAVFVPMENKKDEQVAADMALTPQQRVDRMFELIDSLLHLQKEYILVDKENCITLKRKGGAVS